jgi:hypothetical protein
MSLQMVRLALLIDQVWTENLQLSGRGRIVSPAFQSGDRRNKKVFSSPRSNKEGIRFTRWWSCTRSGDLGESRQLNCGAICASELQIDFIPGL